MLTLVTLDDHRSGFLDALLARDSARARRVVEQALEDGIPIPDIYLGMLAPAMQEVGHRWAMGELNVAEEHYATAVAQSILDGLGRRLRARRRRTGGWRSSAGHPEELHALGTRVVADFLETDGWEVLQLGTGAPADDIAALVESEQPDLVALSTATAGVIEGVVEVLQALRAISPRPCIVAGGRFWTEETSPGRDRVRRRPRHPGPARARRAAARADPAPGG